MQWLIITYWDEFFHSQMGKTSSILIEDLETFENQKVWANFNLAIEEFSHEIPHARKVQIFSRESEDSPWSSEVSVMHALCTTEEAMHRKS